MFDPNSLVEAIRGVSESIGILCWVVAIVGIFVAILS